MDSKQRLNHLTDAYVKELKMFQKASRLKGVIFDYSKISFVQNYGVLNNILIDWNIEKDELNNIESALIESTELLKNYEDSSESVLDVFDKAFYGVYSAYSTDFHSFAQSLAQRAYISINAVSREAKLSASGHLRVKKVLNAFKLNTILAVKQNEGVIETLPAHLRINSFSSIVHSIQSYIAVIGSLVQLSISDLEHNGIANLEGEVYSEMFVLLDNIFSQEDLPNTKYLLEDGNGDLYFYRTKLTKSLLQEGLKGGWLYSESGDIVSIKVLDKKIAKLEDNHGRVVDSHSFL